jgi:hypothetical protein
MEVMADKSSQIDTSEDSFTSDAVRQRWQLFHRAIAFAKKSNTTALQESEISGDEAEPVRKLPTAAS